MPRPTRLRVRRSRGTIATEEPALYSLARLATSGGSDGFQTPSIEEFFPGPLAFQGTAFELNRIMLVRIVVAVVICGVFWVAARRATLVPGRAQGMVEMVLDFVRVGIAEEIIGSKRARGYVPLLTTMFVTILAMNLAGVVPLLNIAGTSVVGFPLVMAIVAYVAFIIAGIRAHGGVGYFKSALFPAGIPWPVYILLTPIEFISTFVLRPATLTIRLLVNMIAGHLLLVLAFSATHYLFFEATGVMKAMGAVTLAGGIAFTLFELFIAVLQAYIFTLLTAVYINFSQEAH